MCTGNERTINVNRTVSILSSPFFQVLFLPSWYVGNVDERNTTMLAISGTICFHAMPEMSASIVRKNDALIHTVLLFSSWLSVVGDK